MSEEEKPESASGGPAADDPAAGLPAAYQQALLETVTDIDAVNDMLERSLEQEDVARILHKLGREERDLFLAKLKELVRKTAALLLVSRRLADATSLDTLLARMVELISDFLDAERSTIFLHDPATDELYTRAAVGLAAETRFASGRGIAGTVFRSGQPLRIADAYADPRFNPEIDAVTGFHTQSVLCVPLRHVRDGEARIVGVVEVLNKRSGSFGEEDVRLLSGLNSQAASAFVGALLQEEVQKARAEELELLELTMALSTELQLRPLLVKIVDAVARFLAAERATLFMHDRKTDELWALVGQGERLEQIRFPARAGIAGHVFATRETVSIRDAYADPRFNPEMDTRTGYRTRNILCMPVVDRRSETIGVVQVLNKRGGDFTSLDAKRLAAFSAQAAVAIENSTLFEAYLEKQRADQGLRLAHQIQMSMLPRNFPQRPEVELAARLIPARSVGGDLYDFADQGKCLWFLIADVAGKGVGAALIMAVTKTLFRAAVRPEAAPSQVISRMNSELCRDNERCLFVTAFLGRLDLQTGELRYSNAGHNRPYRLGRDGSLQPVSDGCGMALGIFEGEGYPEAGLKLTPGEGLYLYTDGVTEALDAGEAEFSLARLEAQLRAAGAAKAHDIVEGTVAAVRAFVGEAPQSDDLTVLALRYGGDAGATP